MPDGTPQTPGTVRDDEILEPRVLEDDAPDVEIETQAEDERLELLTDLIEELAYFSDERIEEDNPFREKTRNEKINGILKRTAIRVGIGVLFGAITVATAGTAALPMAASAIASGLLVSSVAGGAVDIVKRVSGAEKQERDLRAGLGQDYMEKRMALREAAQQAKRAEYGIAEDAEGNPLTIEAARQGFIETVIDVTNDQSKKRERKQLHNSEKKWRWWKFGVSVASGVLAGGYIAELFRHGLERAAENVGIHVAGHGLGPTSEYIKGLVPGHHVHMHNGEVVFDYNDGELQEISRVVQQHQDKFVGMFLSTSHAQELAQAGMHEGGAQLAQEFSQQVAGTVGSQVAETFGLVSAAVIADGLIGPVTTKRQYDYYDKEDAALRRELTQVAKDSSGTTPLLASAAFRRFTGGAPEYGNIGEQIELLNTISLNLDQGQPTASSREFNPGDKFLIIGLSSDGKIVLEPVNQELNQRADRGRVFLTKEDFDQAFMPPRDERQNPVENADEGIGTENGEEPFEEEITEGGQVDTTEEAGAVTVTPEETEQTDDEEDELSDAIPPEKNNEGMIRNQLAGVFKKRARWQVNPDNSEAFIYGNDGTRHSLKTDGAEYEITGIGFELEKGYVQVSIREVGEAESEVMRTTLPQLVAAMEPKVMAGLSKTDREEFVQILRSMATEKQRSMVEKRELSSPEEPKDKRSEAPFLAELNARIKPGQIWEWTSKIDDVEGQYQLEIAEFRYDPTNGQFGIRFKGDDEGKMKWRPPSDWEQKFSAGKLISNTTNN